MIISASYRTDLPAFYGKWFMNRLDAGNCEVRNPYNGKINRVSLQPEDLDGFVFWTKNVGPFLDSLQEIHQRGIPFIVQYTISGYPTALERSVPEPDRSVRLLKLLSESFGSRTVVWRYDPIIDSDLTPADWHVENFRNLSDALRGTTDEVVVSFAQIYRKTRRNMDISARQHEISWTDPAPDQKIALLNQLAEIAGGNNMRLTVCAQPLLMVNGIEGAKCIDSARLSDVANKPISAKTKGNRPDCLCSVSRDIGAYDSCPMGCAYCYAVRNRDIAQANYTNHDPNNASLFGEN